MNRQTTEHKIWIDLDGPDGNAFNLLGVARKLSEELGLDDRAINEEMRSGDYNNLVEVFEKHFGDYVHLEWSDFA